MGVEMRETILVVDDEEAILKLVDDFFSARGYVVTTAANGAAAIGLLEQVEIDCCFTDINMPQMNGLELAEHIHRTHPALPVIIMTGYPSLENAVRTLKNGVVDFLIKPVNLREMELCLQRVLRQRSLFIENLVLKNEVKAKQRLEDLNRELTAKVDELDTLNRILTHYANTATSAEVFKRTVDLVLELVQADESRFYVLDEAARQPHQVAAAFRQPAGQNPSGDRSAVASRNAGDTDGSGMTSGLIMGVFADGIPLLVAENQDTQPVHEKMPSLMAVPLKIRAKVFGVLTAAAGAGKSFNEKALFYLSFATQSAATSIENLALYENIYENLFATLYAFVKALEARDLYTRQHSSRVTQISLAMGRALGCTQDELDVLHCAGHLHDIGKIGIRDDILLKPDRLTAEEFEKIKEHPVIGADILNQVGLWDRERKIIRCHHERFDGTGYPDGLRGENIPFLARILSVADAYDAMASDRSYRKRMEEARILEIILHGAGTQFDPAVVAAFNDLHRTQHLIPPRRTPLTAPASESS
jgi:putative nucleotidyltransferase with HDIG domain